MPSRDRRLAETFLGLCSPDRRQDWARGFDRAMRLGRAGLPLLSELADRQAADTRRRLLLLAAASVGGGRAADPILFRAIGRSPAGVTGVQERFLISLAIALGGPRPGSSAVLTELAERSGLEDLEKVALAVALARYADGPGPPASWYRDQDAAVVAAACLARAPRDTRSLERWLERDARHVDLVRRGYVLGTPPERFEKERASRLVDWLRARGDEAHALRLATAVHLSGVPDPAAWLDAVELPLDGEILAEVAAEPAFRAELFRRGLLVPLSPRLPAELRGRVAVEFALATDAAALGRTADEWAADPVAGPALSLAIAWRFLEDPQTADPAWIASLPDVRETEWVRLACGLPPVAPTRPMRDDRLDSAFLVAASSAPDGGERLDRGAAAEAIEDALWRSGAHPAIGRRLAELDLIRDLLLAGSTHGAAVLGATDPRRHTLPRGLSPGDTVFEIGYELYLFVREPAPKRPEWVRLR